MYPPAALSVIEPYVPVAAVAPNTGKPVPATNPVTGPTGAVEAPSAPILSLVITLPLTFAVFSVIDAVSAVAIGASSMIAILSVPVPWSPKLSVTVMRTESVTLLAV